ncbi:MAG: amidohydrolase family protein [Actinomycetota bacterium]
MSGRFLIRNGCVLTLGPRTPNLPEGDVLVDDGKVAELGHGLRARDAEVVDASEAIVMPGFVDTHRHVWRSLFRNIGDKQIEGPESLNHYQPDDVYAATLIGLLGAIEAGITTVVDWSDIQIDDRYTEASLQAHADAGLRTVLVYAATRGAASDTGAGAALRRLSTGRGGLPIPIAYGWDQPTSSLDDVVGEWKLARELGLRIHAHSGPSAGVVSTLAVQGLLGRDVTLVHCSDLDDGDLDAVSSHGASVSLTPSSEMAAGLGSTPIQKLIDRGIRPGLGIDNELISPGDMFAQMRAAISLQHATLFDLKLAGKAGLPHLLSTRDVIRYATIDGARAAGLGGLTGSLEPGKQADLVILRGDRPNIAPINDPIGAVVWGMDTSNIDWVFVAGKPLMRNGVLQAEVNRARELAMTARLRISAAAAVAPVETITTEGAA